MPPRQPADLGQDFSYNLNATDVQIIIYSVNTTDFTIDGTGLLENNTVLGLGAYHLQLNASDGTNHNITTIIVTVSDTITPQWDGMPQDQPAELGQDFSYNLNATDVQTIIYSVNTTDFTIDGTGLLENNNVLGLGAYHLQLNASDGTNHNITIIIVTVRYDCASMGSITSRSIYTVMGRLQLQSECN